MPKIAHIADTHIRNLKYHDDYREVFEHLYNNLRENKVDYIVHCGDIAHTKTQLSPEYFALATEFLYNLAEIAPTYVILGNHDGNLKNSNREDAITPIVTALGHKSLHLLKNSGEIDIGDDIVLNVLSVFDRENWIKPTNENKINIALYHGAIRGSKTAVGYTLDHGEDDISIFDGFDFAMLGDIHKPQALDFKKRIRYAGSTIQQNFGEEGDKGYLLWDIKDRWNWKADHITFPHPRPFITIKLEKNGSIPKGATIPPDARLRIVSTSNLPLDKIRKVTDLTKTKFSPFSVAFLNRGLTEYTEEIKKELKAENLRKISTQEKWIRSYLKDYELEEETFQEIFKLNSKYNRIAEQNEEVTRNVVWKIKEMSWDNLFNYGPGNHINFEKIRGLVGIFGKNYSGKSSIIDSALFGLFNTTSKEERKNVHIINQNKEKANVKLVLTTENQSYQVCRNLTRYTKKLKGTETTEAKTELDFTNLTTGESVNGVSRNDTDANIRKVFGGLEDFMITSMAGQLDSLSFIREGSTKRKEIFAKFLDLDIFDQKFKMAKKDSSEIATIIKRFKQKNLYEQIEEETAVLDFIGQEYEIRASKCEALKNKKEKLLAELTLIQKDMEDLPAEIIDISEVNRLIEAKKSDIETLLDHRVALVEQGTKNAEIIEEIDRFCANIDIEDLKSLQNEQKQHNSNKKSFSAKLKTNQVRSKNQQKRVDLLDGIPCGNEYPDCKFICDANKAIPELEETKQTIATIEANIADIECNLQDLDSKNIEENIQKYQELVSKRAKLENEIEKSFLSMENNKAKIDLLENEISALKDKQDEYNNNKHIIENLETLNREKKGITVAVGKLEKEMTECSDKMQSLLIEKGSTSQNLSRLQEEHQEYVALEKEWVAYEMFMRCMHPNGIAYEIIKQKLPIINDEAAKILTNIVDFEVFFENNGKKLDIFIKHPQYEPRPLSMGSGAEKTIASMAIRLALISITNLPKSELFILDEPATALDQEHMEGFVRLLDMIKGQFKTVLLISHLEALKDVVDMTIDINKSKGYAKVKLK